MDENTQGAITGFDTQITAPASSNGCRQQDTDQHASRPCPTGFTETVRSTEQSRSRGDTMNRLLRVEEVASLLSVPRKWVYRRVGLKTPYAIPHLKIGKYLRFREADVQHYIERLRRN